MGYHLKEIEKGIYGEWSKIHEETLELEDAYTQQAKLLIFCELSDLVGAITEYCKKKKYDFEYIFNTDYETNITDYLLEIIDLVKSKSKYAYNMDGEILSSVIFCIKEYVKKYNLSFYDILKFSIQTQDAFKEGKR